MTRNSLYIIIVLVLLNSCSKSDSKNCASLSLKGDVLASDPCKPSGSILITGLSANGLQYKIDNQNWQTASTFSNVSAGNHKITVVTKDGCEDTLTVIVPKSLAGNLFTNAKQVLANNCLGCHNGNNPQAGINFTNDCDVILHADRIQARAIQANPTPMPPTGLISVNERNVLTNWIVNGGSLYNK